MTQAEYHECHRIEVIGGLHEIPGIYDLTDERSDDAPENPVWKKKNEDISSYIFNTGDSMGWRIGNSVKFGFAYFYKSNMQTLPLTEEIWPRHDLLEGDEVV